MFCTSCWANLPDTAATCTKCGCDPRARAPARPAPGPEPGSVGTVSPAPAAAEAADGPADGARRRAALRIVALGVGIGVLAGLALVLVRALGGKASPPGGAGSVAVSVSTGVGVTLPAVEVEMPSALPAVETSPDLGGAAALYRSAYEAHESGDFTKAASILREALEKAPDHPVLTTALATTLEAQGSRALGDGDFAVAAGALAEVVALDADRGNAWKGLGYAQVRLDQPKAAVESLETAARLLPRDAQTRLLLGTVLYQSGDTARALEHLRAARAAAPGDPQTEALLARVEREAKAEAGFGKATSRHFTVSFEGGGTSEQAGYLVGLLLEDAYHTVGAGLDYYPDDAVQAVLYPAEAFRDVTRSPTWAGALFDGKIRIPVGGLTEKTDLLARTAAHEYTHAVVHRLARGHAPVWLNEGLAQLSEGEGRSDVQGQFRAYVRGGAPLESLRSLEGSFADLNEAQAQLAYAQSLAATDYLVKTYGRPAARAILAKLGNGVPLAEAIRSTVYVSYEDLDRAWAASLR